VPAAGSPGTTLVAVVTPGAGSLFDVAVMVPLPPPGATPVGVRVQVDADVPADVALPTGVLVAKAVEVDVFEPTTGRAVPGPGPAAAPHEGAERRGAGRLPDRPGPRRGAARRRRRADKPLAVGRRLRRRHRHGLAALDLADRGRRPRERRLGGLPAGHPFGRPARHDPLVLLTLRVMPSAGAGSRVAGGLLQRRGLPLPRGGAGV